MNSERQIVGICLVRNEDLFVEQALRNVLDFCDRILVADDRSSDGTAAAVQALAAAEPKVTYRRIRHPRESHDMIEAFAGTSTWVLGVDGDELYDPVGLVRMRRRILGGEFEAYRQIYGNVLNCVELDRVKGRASGYLAPPCRSMTKLYNFGALEAWRGPCPERLHGGAMVFRPGREESPRCKLHQSEPWDESPFRCLHVVFLRRSTRDHADAARINISEQNQSGLAGKVSRVLRAAIGRPPVSEYKYEKYRRGERVEKDVAVFMGGAPGVAGVAT